MDELRTPTPRELAILKVLWQQGPSTVREVHRHFVDREREEVAYNTIQTMLRLMEEKGLATSVLQGRGYLYRAVFTRDATTASFLDRVYDGAASQLVQSLLSSENLSESELDHMQYLIEQARRRQKGEQT